MEFDPLEGRYLLVWGLDQAEIWTVDVTTGAVSDRLSLRLPTDEADAPGAAPLLSAAWLPGRDTWVCVTGAFGAALYELTNPRGTVAPAVTVRLPGATPLAAAVVVPSVWEGAAGDPAGAGVRVAAERLTCVMLSREGQLLAAPLPDTGLFEASGSVVSTSSSSSSSSPAGETVRLEAAAVTLPSGAPAVVSGIGLHRSAASGLLLASIETTGGERRQLLLRLDPSGMRCVEACEWDPWPISEAAAIAGEGGSNGSSSTSGGGGGCLLGCWEVPLLPPSRAHLRCPQLFVCSDASGGGTASSSSGSLLSQSGPPQRRTAVVALGADLAPGGAAAGPSRGWSCRSQQLPLQRGGGDVVGVSTFLVPATAQTVAMVVTTSGNLLFYTTPRVPGLRPPLPPPPAQSAAAEPAAGEAAAAAAAAAAVAPFDEPERSELVNDRVRLSGDTSHIPGGSPAASRLLLDRGDPEAYFEAAAPGTVRLALRLPTDSGLAIVGVRMLVGASGGAFAPTQLLVGDGAAARTAHLAPRDGGGAPRRWFAAMLAPSESLASEVVLQIGPAREPGLRVRLHQIDVYAQPRPLVAQRAADAAVLKAADAAGPGPAAEALAVAATSDPRQLAAAAPDAAGREQQLALLVRCGAAGLALLPGAAGAPCQLSDCQPVVWQLLCPLPPLASAFVPSWATERDGWTLLALLTDGSSSSSQTAPDAVVLATPAEQWRDAARVQSAAAILLQLARQHPAGRAAPWEEAHAFAYLHAAALIASVAVHGPQALVPALRSTMQQQQQQAGGAGGAPGAPLRTDSDATVGAAAVRCLSSVLAWLHASSRSPFLPPALLQPLLRALLQLLEAEAAVAAAPAGEEPQLEDWAGVLAGAAPAGTLAAALLLNPDPEARQAASTALPGLYYGDSGPAGAAFLAATAAAVVRCRGVPGPRLLPAYNAVALVASSLADADPELHHKVRIRCRF